MNGDLGHYIDLHFQYISESEDQVPIEDVLKILEAEEYWRNCKFGPIEIAPLPEYLRKALEGWWKGLKCGICGRELIVDETDDFTAFCPEHGK